MFFFRDFVMSGFVNPKRKKTPLEISRRASLVPSKISTYLVVLHNKWFTWFSHLNNCLFAFDYEEVYINL